MLHAAIMGLGGDRPGPCAEAAAALIADEADGGNSGVAIICSVSLAGGGWGN